MRVVLELTVTSAHCAIWLCFAALFFWKYGRVIVHVNNCTWAAVAAAALVMFAGEYGLSVTFFPRTKTSTRDALMRA